MSTLQLSRLAIADLRAIRDFTAMRWGKPQSDRYLADIGEALELLSAYPSAASYWDGPYRKYVVGRHVIFITAESAVRVVRILHQSADVDPILPRSKT